MNLESFLYELRERPDDLGQRLVFADWLEDNGDPERAELVRLQCTAVPYGPWDQRDGTAGTPRERELIDAICARWLPDAEVLKNDGLSITFRRGMVQMSCREEGIARGHERFLELCQSGWVEQLELDVYESDFLRNLSTEVFAQVNRLYLAVEHGRPEHLTEFLAGLPQLRQLDIFGINTWPGVSEMLAAFPRLESLGWSNPNEIAPLLSHCARLHSLHLAEETVYDGELNQLLDSISEDRLRTLELIRPGLSVEGIAYLAGCEKLCYLTALRLSSAELDDKAVASLAASPHLRRLVHLDLSHNHLTHAAMPALAESPLLAQLVTLTLSGNRLSADAARCLANSPHLGKLERLFLSNCHISTAGARELVYSDRLAGLRHIDLDRNPIDGHTYAGDPLDLHEWRERFGLSDLDNPTSQETRELCRFLREGSPPLRRRAVGILSRLWMERYDDLPAEVDAALVRALGDSEEVIRLAASNSLKTHLPGVAVLPELLPLRTSEHEGTRAFTQVLIAALEESDSGT